MKLYQFSRFFRRDGTLEGLFIAEPYEVNKLIGTNVYFGEALGKHSSISCVIAEQDIKQLSVSDSTVIDLYNVIGSTISGYNPLDYLHPDDE
jgi:hypothetical protein